MLTYYCYSLGDSLLAGGSPFSEFIRSHKVLTLHSGGQLTIRTFTGSFMNMFQPSDCQPDSPETETLSGLYLYIFFCKHVKQINEVNLQLSNFMFPVKLN